MGKATERERERFQIQLDTRKARERRIEMKRDRTINERGRERSTKEGTCICMGKARVGRRGLEGERESDRDAVEEGDQGSRGIKTEGGKRTEGTRE
ncbi:hypothetical protein X777_09039 [Ooceraea biroi]|uniref:Uncharacterized protein n=1 Tax=Ooceraea biroi TaxID=2015173 RepID=A0A026W7P2_OOCBI|nr:hypothetical protein X777_09039 [Ooceraea biroi]